MPEITSVDAIRAKLREFDERVDGAIAAAKTLARVKADAEKLLKELEGLTGKGEETLKNAESIRGKLQDLNSEWGKLKQEVEKSLSESKETRELLLSEIDSAIQGLGKKVSEAEERLRSTNKTSLAEQAERLKNLDSSTRANAELATNAKALVLERAEKLELMLASLREELQSETRTKFQRAEELVASQVQQADKALDEKLECFKEEMRQNLAKHQESIDQRLTEFLNKQNALVQNLTQQINSYHGVSQALSADFAATKKQLNELSSAIDRQKTDVTSELAEIVTTLNGLKALVAEVQAGLTSKGESIAALDSSLQEVSARLREIVEKLGKRSWLTGVK